MIDTKMGLFGCFLINKIVDVVVVNQYSHFAVLDVTNQLQGLGVEKLDMAWRDLVFLVRSLQGGFFIQGRGGILQVWFKGVYN